MKKIFIVLLIVSLPLMAGIGNKFYLGYTIHQVKRHYGRPLESTSNMFYYPTRYFGRSGYRAFFHHNNRIFQTIIMITEKSNINNVIQNYVIIQNALTKKYGKFQTKNQWVNNMFRGYAKYATSAIQAGHVRIIRSKIIGKYMINHILYYENYKPFHSIAYIDINLQRKEIAEKNYKNNNDL